MGIVEKVGPDTFFGRIKAYYDVRGWEAPGTKEQFEEAATQCWALKVVTHEDGSKWYEDPHDQALINCRAQVAGNCFHRKPVACVYGDGNPITGDGTWRSEGDHGTIICDSCYLVLCRFTPSGRGLLDELDGAIEAVRKGIS